MNAAAAAKARKGNNQGRWHDFVVLAAHFNLCGG